MQLIYISTIYRQLTQGSEYEKIEQEMKAKNPSFSWDDVPEDVKNDIASSVNEAIENDIKQANMYNPPPVENHE